MIFKWAVLWIDINFWILKNHKYIFEQTAKLTFIGMNLQNFCKVALFLYLFLFLQVICKFDWEFDSVDVNTLWLCVQYNLQLFSLFG